METINCSSVDETDQIKLENFIDLEILEEGFINFFKQGWMPLVARKVLDILL
jgi:hypothetical protein